MVQLDHIIGNKKLVQFKELKEAVISNAVRGTPELKSEKKEENKTLLEF